MGEVISVVQRRRRWSAEQKVALLEEAMRPGSSVAGVADRHGLSRSLLFDWRRQMREGTMPGVVRADAATTLVPVHIVKDAPPKGASRPLGLARRPAERAAKPATIEVVLPNGRVLRVSEAIAPEVLGRLAAALDS
jgi:transposase